MADTSLVFNVVGRDQGVNAMLTRTANTVRTFNARAAASTIGLAGAFGVAGAAAAALAGSAIAAAGAVGMVPAALASVFAIVGAGKAATMGMSEAWKATGVAASGGGRSVQAAAQKTAAANREVRMATRQLAEAQKDAREAQEAVTQARIDETERLSDLSRNLRGARLDETDAVAAVAKAEMDLAQARQTGNADKIGDAERAYEQSKQTLEDVRDRVSDLAKEHTEGAKKGVEGSDAVQEALDRQKQAQQAVTDAAENLALAQQKVETASAGAAGGGINPAAEALAKLSPNGRAVIMTLRDLAPAWHAAAMVAQNETFAGVSGDLRQLSSMYLPMVTSWLGRMGRAFNTAIRESMGIFKTREGFNTVKGILSSVALVTERLAKAVAPIINGLLQWVAIGVSFLPGFASDAVGLAETFERWSIHMRKSGEGAAWIRNGITVLRQFWAIARDVAMSIFAIFQAGNDGGSFVTKLQRGAAAMRRFFESAETQEKLRTAFAAVRDIVATIVPLFMDLAGNGDSLASGLGMVGTAAQWAAENLGWVAKYLPAIAAAYLLLKASGVGQAIRFGIDAAQVAAQIAMATAMRAHTRALQENTVAAGANSVAAGTNAAATNAGIVARLRAVASWVAEKVALIANTVVKGAAAVAGWALAAAEWAAASPIIIIIALIAAFAVGLYLLWTRHEGFRKAVIAVWEAIKKGAENTWNWIKTTWPKLVSFLLLPYRVAWAGIQRIWAWLRTSVRETNTYIVGKFNGLVNWFKDLPRKIGNALLRIGSVISAPFRAAFNAVARLWNGTIGGLGFSIPSWVPGVGGNSFRFPYMPYLAKGGHITGAGLAMVGERGPEIVNLPTGASVTPLDHPSVSNRGGGCHHTFDVTGADRHLKALIREMFRNGGLQPGG